MKKIKIIVGLIVVLTLSLLVFMWTSKSADTSKDAPMNTTSASESPTPVPPPTPASTSAPRDVDEDGEEFVVPFLAAESGSRNDPSTPVIYADIATDTALKDLEAQALEFEESGLVQVGSPEVVSATIVDFKEDSDPEEMRVLACLDYSSVDIVDGNGDSAKSDGAPQRVSTLLTLVREDTRWLVKYRSFPNDGSC